MKWVPALVTFLIGFFMSSCCHVGNQVPSLVNGAYSGYDYRGSVVKLQAIVANINKPVMFATGFAISEEKIITAAHFCISVLEGQIFGPLKQNIGIVTLDNNDKLVELGIDAVIDNADKEMDLCVIKAKHGLVPLKLVDNYESLRVYQDVSIVGAPLGIFPTQTNGHIITLKSTGWETESLNDRLIVSAPVTFGNSGGPIFAKNGEVVGVVMAMHKIYSHIVLAVTADTIKEYLKREYGK